MNRRPRSLSDHLGAAAYEALRTSHSGLCRNVEDLLRLGQTPKQIADYVERVGTAELAGLAKGWPPATSWPATAHRRRSGSHPPTPMEQRIRRRMEHHEKILRVAERIERGDFAPLTGTTNPYPGGEEALAKEVATILRGFTRADRATGRKVLTAGHAARY